MKVVDTWEVQILSLTNKKKTESKNKIKPFFKLWLTLNHLIFRRFSILSTPKCLNLVKNVSGFIIRNLTKYFVKCMKNGAVLSWCKINGICFNFLLWFVIFINGLIFVFFYLYCQFRITEAVNLRIFIKQIFKLINVVNWLAQVLKVSFFSLLLLLLKISR